MNITPEAKVSIILPVYNAECYLSSTLNSLRAQTYTNIEVLCINDGSKDNSLEILNQIAREDERFRVFDQVNSGPAKARNCGLDNATGDYLMFCDADDLYDPCMVEKMLSTMLDEKVDFVMCDCSILVGDIDHGRTAQQLDYHNLTFFNKIKLTQIIKPRINVLLWNKIFRMDLIRQYAISFPNGFQSDDNAFIYQYLAVSSAFFGLKEKLYSYRVSSNSIMGDIFHHKKTEKLYDYIHVFQFTIDFFKKHNMLKENIWILRPINNNINFTSSLFTKEEFPKYTNLLKTKILQHFNIEDFAPHSNISNLFKVACNSTKKKTLRLLGLPIFKKYSYPNKRKYVLLGIPIFKKSISSKKRKYYVLGIRFFSKRSKLNQNIAPSNNELVNNTRSEADHINELMDMRANSKELAANGQYFLCFDCLYDSSAEAIDAYTFYKYLKSINVPCTYVITKYNQKADIIANDQDVLLVDNEFDLLYDYKHLVAKATHIISSFGGLGSFNRHIKNLPSLKYIYMEHGVIWLKKWVCSLYSPQNYDYILVPSKKTHELYIKNQTWSDDRVLLSGLPRWDNLQKVTGDIKNIFIFFTWCKTFEANSQATREYFETILHLVNSDKLRELASKHNIKINLALHHALFHNNVEVPDFPDFINIVEPNSISKHIGKTDLLITDYSSICFDFMYLDIPVLFYLFGANNLSLNDIDQDSIIEVMQEEAHLYNFCYDEGTVLEKISNYANNDFKLEPENLAKNAQIYWDREPNYCEKLYQGILQLKDYQDTENTSMPK